VNTGITEGQLRILDTFLFIYLKDNGYLVYDGYWDRTGWIRSFENLIGYFQKLIGEIQADDREYYDTLFAMEREQLAELYNIQPDISHWCAEEELAGPLKPSFMLRRF
jgi:hypothetical protein